MSPSPPSLRYSEGKGTRDSPILTILAAQLAPTLHRANVDPPARASKHHQASSSLAAEAALVGGLLFSCHPQPPSLISFLGAKPRANSARRLASSLARSKNFHVEVFSKPRDRQLRGSRIRSPRNGLYGCPTLGSRHLRPGGRGYPAHRR